MQVRAVVVSWLLLMVTLALVAYVAANWYERKANTASDSAGVSAEMANGWEPTPYAPGSSNGSWYWRRPRLHWSR